MITTLPGDSYDYDVLYRAVYATRDISGLSVEIGVRRGGGIQHIVDALANTGKTIIGIDPYGNIEYAETDNSTRRLDYTNIMKNEALASIYRYVGDKGINFVFYNMEDTEWMSRFGTGVPIYNEYKTIVNDYAFVHFDGPHDTKSVYEETLWFMFRASTGACFVYDDVGTYNHNKIDQLLIENGWSVIEHGKEGRKIAYIKQVEL